MILLKAFNPSYCVWIERYIDDKLVMICILSWQKKSAMCWFFSVSIFFHYSKCCALWGFSSLKCFINMNWISTWVLLWDVQLFLLFFTNEQAATNYMIFFLLWFIVVCLPQVFWIISEHNRNFMDKIIFRFLFGLSSKRQLAWFITQL